MVMPYLRAIAVIVILFLFDNSSSQPHREIQCRDPDVGGTTQNKNRKFILFGADSSQGAGIGNLLIFFPAVYYFAAFSGRDIILGDSSIVGEMCKIVTCGFPFANEMALAFPSILGQEDVLRKAPVVKMNDFQRWVELSRNIDEDVVYGFGYKSESDWWTYFNSTVHCVRKITGCDLGDVGCSDRHAYQRLVRGPFKTALSKEEEGRIKGVPDHIKHAILTLPHSYAPRLDAAVHIRNSFHHFEQQANISDPGYKKEVDDWLNSTECFSVFDSLKVKLLDLIDENRKNLNATKNDAIYVYLAADNEQVKEAFEETLKMVRHGEDKMVINVMRVETKFVQHIKNLAKMKASTNNEGLLDLVFDWYSLTLSNVVIAWRKGSTSFVSTFVHSAQRLSGTTERTSTSDPISHAIGTKGYQLTKDRNGDPKWDPMWSYGFLEDYQI